MLTSHPTQGRPDLAHEYVLLIDLAEEKEPVYTQAVAGETKDLKETTIEVQNKDITRSSLPSPGK
jgi:hypothetical protein